MNGARIFGSFCFVVGFGLMAYFLFFFDTSVASNTPGGLGLADGLTTGRTVNLGLMTDKISGMIAGAALFIGGTVMGSAAGEKSKE